jgi:hypothetical protein
VAQNTYPVTDWMLEMSEHERDASNPVLAVQGEFGVRYPNEYGDRSQSAYGFAGGMLS